MAAGGFERDSLRLSPAPLPVLALNDPDAPMGLLLRSYIVEPDLRFLRSLFLWSRAYARDGYSLRHLPQR